MMMRHKRTLLGALATAMVGLMVGSAGCESDDGAGKGDETAAAECIPSRTVWNDTTQKMITDHCGDCHGKEPQFGASVPLVSYDDMIKGAEGKRPVDWVANRLANKTMPAAGFPPPPHQVQDTITEWASCGAKHPDHSIGLTASKPAFKAPAEIPKDTESFDLLAPDFEVGPKVLDLYMCFTFDVPVKADRFIRRIAPVIGESRVLHHIVLLRDPKKKTKVGASKCKGMPGGSQYLYAWAPGAAAVQFHEGGLRVTPGERYIVQIHYNNGAGVSDAKDKSGVRIHHAKPGGPEYGMFAPGPLAFAIPAGQTYKSTGTCKIKNKMTFIAGMPHMHEIGSKFDSYVVRKDGTKEELITITGWNFEMQPFYHFPMTVEPGDKLLTSCTWHNKTKESVVFGTGTGDEMCFNFMFATPPPKSAYCNDFDVEDNADVAYARGECAGDGAIDKPPRSETKVQFKAAPDVKGGQLEDAQWSLTSASLHLPVLVKQYIDEESFIVGRGQAVTKDGNLHLDVRARILLKIKGGIGNDSTQILSIAGKVVAGKKAGEATLEPTCGATNKMVFKYGVDGNKLTVVLTQKLQQFDVPAVYIFERGQ